MAAVPLFRDTNVAAVTSHENTLYWFLVIVNDCFPSGSQSILTYATSHGLICGLDLRTSQMAWKLENELSHGNINFALK